MIYLELDALPENRSEGQGEAAVQSASSRAEDLLMPFYGGSHLLQPRFWGIGKEFLKA